MGFQGALVRVADIQKKYTIPIFVVVVIFTIITAAGLPNLKLQTDFTKEMPQDIPIVKLNERITDTFNGQDTLIVVGYISYRAGKKK